MSEEKQPEMRQDTESVVAPAAPGPTHYAEVASHVPGRLRVRLHPDSRKPEVTEQIKKALEGQQGVHEVEVNHLTGSIAVKYDTEVHEHTGIFGLLEDLDVIVGTLTEAPHLEEVSDGQGHSEVAVTFAGALDDVDRRIYALTGRKIDLKILLPLALAGFGVWQIMQYGLMIEVIPGFLLIWFAFDAFLKLHHHVPGATPAQA